MGDMPIRIMEFDLDPAEVKKKMPMAFGLYGASMTLPYLEPYLIRTMREALKLVTDDDVRQEVRQFIGQEAQHFRQHRALNDMVRAAGPKLAGLQQIEDDMEADYQRFTNTKSLKFNLAYAEGFEAATCAVARNIIEFNLLGDSDDDAVIKLFRWHLTEEVEHRTVTFNIYKHLFGGYFYRLVFGIYGQWHFFKYVRRFAKFINENQPEQEQAMPDSNQAANMDSQAPKAKGGAAADLRWQMFRTYLPWYDPAKVEIPQALEENSTKYSDQALEIRLPN